MIQLIHNDGGLRDYHTHTSYSDGKNTPREMIEAAIDMGVKELGISDHAYADCDIACCIPRDMMPRYFAELSMLRKEYEGKISLRTGLEIDYYCNDFVYDYDYDYSIGSVHYIKAEGCDVNIDFSAANQADWVGRYFGGDYYAAAEKYFALVGEIVEKTDCDIIGHFDLFSKFNEDGRLYDPNDPRYVAAWKKAADRLLPTGRIFEINTGAISRGCRTTPYPSGDIMRYLSDRGAKFILSSDAHRAQWLCWEFEKHKSAVNI